MVGPPKFDKNAKHLHEMNDNELYIWKILNY